MSEWISVKDRLPETDDRVLVVLQRSDGARIILTASFWHGMWCSGGKMLGVTHWMPLPALPEVKDHE